MDFYSQSQAAFEIDPAKPPSRETVQAWHDRVSGPRDSSGRRVYTREVIDQIRSARATARRTARRGKFSAADMLCEEGIVRSSVADIIRDQIEGDE